MAENRERAEIMVLELMDQYSFSLTDFKGMLRRTSILKSYVDLHRSNSLELSFSNVKYRDTVGPRYNDPRYNDILRATTATVPCYSDTAAYR